MMPAPLTVLASYFILTPLILGSYKFYNSIENLRKISKQINPISKRIKNGTPTKYLAYATWASIFLLCTLALLNELGIKPNKTYAITALIIQALTPIALLIVKLNLIELSKKYKTILKWTASITAISTAFITSIFVDKFITEITHTRAENFPAAQYLLTTIGSLGIYYVTITALSFIIYLAQCGNIVFLIISQGNLYKTKKRAVRIAFKLKPSRTDSRTVDMSSEVALLLGLSLFTTIMLTLPNPYLRADLILKNTQQLIVFSSFHGSGNDCGAEESEIVSLAILPFGKMVVATRLEDGTYNFKPGSCEPSEELTYKNQFTNTSNSKTTAKIDNPR